MTACLSLYVQNFTSDKTDVNVGAFGVYIHVNIVIVWEVMLILVTSTWFYRNFQMTFKRAATDRQLTFEEIAKETRLPVEEVVNTLRPRQNGRHFPDDIFKCIFLNENGRVSIKISLKFVPKVPINNIPALVEIMAWRRSGDKSLSEPMMVRLPTHICVTRPQWVNSFKLGWCPKLAKMLIIIDVDNGFSLMNS